MKKIFLILILIITGSIIFLKFTDKQVELVGSVIDDKSKNSINDTLMCKDCNLIMISLSNVSAEHMSLYGYKRLTTPNLDKFANNATVFNNAFTQSSWTLPVGVSLFTSLYPYAHGMTDRHTNNVLDENIETLPEILKSNGYKTAAFTGGLDYGRSFGHMRGFDEVVEEGRDVSWPTDFAGFHDTFIKASNWINENKKDKFFIFLHGYDAHCPFDPPEKFKGKFSGNDLNNIQVDSSLCLRGFKRADDGIYEAYYFKDEDSKRVVLSQNDIDYLRDRYDEEISSVDELIGKFLNDMDDELLEKTIIIIFSDHGEMFAKHGMFGRAGSVRGTLYDDVLHVPLIFKIPQQDAKILNGLVQIIDIMPTVIKVLGIDRKPIIQGVSLLPMMDDGKMKINDYVFAGSEFNLGVKNFIYRQKSVNEAVRDDKWKLIHELKLSDSDDVLDETFELYDLENDKDELNDVISKEAIIAAGLKKRLGDWAKDSRKKINNNKTNELPDGFMEEARKRGYW